MRNAVGIFGGIAGAIVVALVARYGFATSDTALDGAIAAFFFAVIAVGGVGGPAVAVHLFRTSDGWARLWGIIAGLIAIVALLANLSNSLGAIAGRADKTLAERAQVAEARKDDRAELARVMREREAMPAFVPTDAAAVEAAKRAADAAARARKAECGDGDPKQRGRNCRAYEATENEANNKLAKVTVAKAATDQSAALDSKADTIRRRLGKAAPVAAINPMAETLARIFHMQADDAATWQQVATVIVVELLIAFSLIAYELLGTARHASVAASIEPPEVQAAPELPAAPAIAEPAVHNPADLAHPAAAAAPGDTASVGRFMLACLPRAQGERAKWGAIYARYKDWCAEQDPPLVPLELPAFGVQFGEICKRVGIRTQSTRKAAYCLDVRLSA